MNNLADSVKVQNRKNILGNTYRKVEKVPLNNNWTYMNQNYFSVFLIYMKAKDYWITWLWTAILMYFLYDVVWILIDYEEFNNIIEDGCTILWIDLCYCFLFALYKLGFRTKL